MSLAPVSLSQPGWNSIASQRLPPPQPAPVSATKLPTTTTSPAPLLSTTRDVSSADELNRELQAQREGSLTYQLIRQLLIQTSQSESESFILDTETLDISLTHSFSTSTTLAMDENSLSFAWTQSESFSATITGEGFSVSIAGSRVQSLQLELERTVASKDPLQIDVAGDGFETTGLNLSVRFDITGDGQQEYVSVAADDDAILAYDQNQNGQIDNGKELFGDQNGHRNGFAELRRYDLNHDAVIDAADRIFASLQLLRWQNDGRQTMQSLTDAGITAISLQVRSVDHLSDQGDRLSADAAVTFANGQQRRIADLWYRYQQAPSTG